MRLRIEKRERVTGAAGLGSVLIAVTSALVVSAILITVSGADLPEALSALVGGAFGNARSVGETLVKATPLMLTGLAAVVAFRGRIWNIGAEGQLIAGAISAYWASLRFAGLPSPVLVPLVILFAFIGGALLGAIPGALKAWRNVDEIIVTVLLNYIVLYMLSYLLSGVWREPSSFYLQTPAIPEAAYLPALFARNRLHAGFLIALAAAVAAHIVLRKTPLGYEIRALGSNPIAARFKGINVPRTFIITMMLSGGLAGLAGGGDLFGLLHRLRMDLSVGYGFTGVIIALLAGLRPLAVIPAAIFFGALVNGATRMQVVTGVPTAFVSAIQGITLILLLAAEVLARYRIRRVRDDI